MLEAVTRVIQFEDAGRSEMEDRWLLEAELGNITYYHKNVSRRD